MKRFGLIIPVFAQSFLLMLPVQATHKEINGCGDDSGLGRFVPNQPVGVDFRPVCDNHDKCYGTLGESREQCDNSFRSALRAKCEKTLLRSAGGIFGTVVTGGQALTSCYGVAETYYRSVRERGGTAYSTAQNHAREELLSTKQAQAPTNLQKDQYLVGDWDGDRRSNLAVRRGNKVLMDFNFDGSHDQEQAYGNGNSEDQYLVGDWDGDGKDNLAVRRGNCVLMDFNFDGSHDRKQCYGNGNSEDQYLVGDWDGDGKDNLAVRRGNCVLMDFNFDDSHDRKQCYGNGNSEDQYLVGDWDGDGKDNLAVRRGNCVLMDFNFDDSHDRKQCYGNGNSEDQYLVGDWDGDGKDNLAVRRGNKVLMDFNFDNSHDREQAYGNE